MTAKVIARLQPYGHPCPIASPRRLGRQRCILPRTSPGWCVVVRTGKPRLDGVPFAPPPTPLGRVCIREDATVMISGAMYDEFCKPRAQRLLAAFAGCIHWCGDAKAWWRSLITLRDLTAVQHSEVCSCRFH